MKKKQNDLINNHSVFFVDRRKGQDRRQDADPCRDLPVDLYHRKRRKSTERRDTSKTLMDDYYAYMQKVLAQVPEGLESNNSKDSA